MEKPENQETPLTEGAVIPSPEAVTEPLTETPYTEAAGSEAASAEGQATEEVIEQQEQQDDSE